MTLSQQQRLFARLVGRLLVWICEQGWEVTFGDFSRLDQQGHMPNSVHYLRLAADLNLFVNGEWMTVSCPEWQAIGKEWESLHPLCRWGGRFKSVDLNHVSLEWQGRA